MAVGTMVDLFCRGRRRWPLFARGAAVAIVVLVVGTALFAPAALAQNPSRLSGTVVLDGDPVSDVPVTLHRVTRDTSGVAGTGVTGPRGGFEFPLPPRDSADGFAVYFVTADYQTVRYFGDPVHPDDASDGYVVDVRPTTTDGSALSVPRRDIVLIPHADGGFEVNEVVRLANGGDRTIVSEGGMPTWRMPIPPDATEFEAGAGDLAGGQVQRMGDELLFMAPIYPGAREVFLRYRLPGTGRSAVATGTAMDSLNLFLRQPGPRLTVAGAEPVEMIRVEGERYLQMSAVNVAADSVLALEWPRRAAIDPRIAGAGASLLLVLIGAGAAFRNRRA